MAWDQTPRRSLVSCIFAVIGGQASALASGGLKSANSPKSLMNTSKISLTLGCVSLLWLSLAQGNAQTIPAPDAFAQNQKLGRSVNVLGYDPIWRSREQGRFKVEYFQKLKAAGFNSVRLNLHAFRHMDATNGLKASWFEVLDWAVKEAQAQGLAVILDLHEFQPLGNDPGE